METKAKWNLLTDPPPPSFAKWHQGLNFVFFRQSLLKLFRQRTSHRLRLTLIYKAAFPAAADTVQVIAKYLPAVRVLVAISTKGLPIAAVRRIIVMIAVLVMYREKLAVSVIKFPGATHAYQTMQRQRSLPIVIIRRLK